MPNSPRGRLAPSPTGAQHLGNARTYLIAWLDAKSRDGDIVLRIEDIDAGRLKPGAADLIIDDLRWLGLSWDDGPVFQSERLAIYRDALDQLKARELVYPCACSRADILSAASAPHAGQDGVTYPGTCSHFRVADAATLTEPFAWRARFGHAPAFTDRFAGDFMYDPAKIGGDFVVWRNDDTPAYQLAVAVDDAAMNVTDVIRGDDLLSSTPKQLWIYEVLGLTPPAWMHVPLVVDAAGKRFAKRDGDVQLKNLRAAGVTAERVLGLLAWSCGWVEEPTPVTARDLVSLYRPATIPKTPWVVTAEVLRRIGPHA